MRQGLNGYLLPIDKESPMSRFVVPRRPGLAKGEPPDGFTARLTKYLPAGILTIYTTAVGSVIASKPEATVAPWIGGTLILVFFFGTIAAFWFKAPTGVVRRAHLIASPIAFLALAYPIAAPLLGGLFVGWLAAAAQGVSALIAWLLEPEEPQEKPPTKP